jgi:hypothetical protein
MAILDEPGITGMIITQGNMPTEEFLAVIRQIVRDEIAKALKEQIRSRGWEAMKPVGPTEQK